jgi:transketolase
VIVLTRQKVAALSGRAPALPAGADEASAWVAHEPAGAPSAVLVATGSEVPITIDAAKLLEAKGHHVRVVSMPCVERFLTRDARAQASLLPAGLPIGTVEAGRTTGWRQFAGRYGLCVGIDTFGHSAPAEVIAEKLGFTPGAIAARAEAWLGSLG